MLVEQPKVLVASTILIFAAKVRVPTAYEHLLLSFFASPPIFFFSPSISSISLLPLKLATAIAITLLVPLTAATVTAITLIILIRLLFQEFD